MNRIRKKITKNFALAVFLLSLCLGGAQPAHAQLFDPIQHLITSFASVTQAMGNWLRANLEVKLADVQAANGANSAKGPALANALLPLTPPQNYPACEIGRAKRLASQINGIVNANAGALALSGVNNSAPNSANLDAKDAMDNGLAVCSGNSPMALANQKLGCKVKWGGQYEGASNMRALFGAYAKDAGAKYNLPVPPGFNDFQVNGNLRMPVVTAQKYMPFVAAYNYCRSLNPNHCAPNSSSKMGSLQAISISQQNSGLNSAFTLCARILAERESFGSELDDPFSKQAHDAQEGACDADEKRNYLDDSVTTTASPADSSPKPDITSYAKCVTDGRSLTQMNYDQAYRGSYHSYVVKGTIGLTNDGRKADENSQRDDIQKIESDIKKEEADLIAAKAASDAAPRSACPGALDNAVTSTP